MAIRTKFSKGTIWPDYIPTNGMVVGYRHRCQREASSMFSASTAAVGTLLCAPVELRLGPLLAHRGLKNRLKLPKIVELNLAAVKRQVMLEDNVHRRAARKFGFRSAGEQNGSEASRRANSGANASTLGGARGDGADPGSRGRCGYDRPYFLAFVAATGDFAFRIRGLIPARLRAARGGPQIDSVAVRQNQGIEAHPKLATTFDTPGALSFQQFAAKVGDPTGITMRLLA